MSNKKISEVAIAQQLISEFCGQQVVFTLDALHCQKKTVSLIINSGNDYLIGLKENQHFFFLCMKTPCLFVGFEGVRI